MRPSNKRSFFKLHHKTGSLTNVQTREARRAEVQARSALPLRHVLLGRVALEKGFVVREHLGLREMSFRMGAVGGADAAA